MPTGTGAIKITVQRLNGTGTVWVDDVRCEEGVSRKEDKTYYYHCDYLGSPRVMTDPLGNVIWRQDYYAFGGDYNTTATGNTHKFTGHVQDAATGQYYAKARYFTTGLGRFSQPDPLLKGVPAKKVLNNPQALNPYIYCINNPVVLFDPTGLEFVYNDEGKDVTGTTFNTDDNSAYMQTEKGLMYIGDMKGEVIIDQIFDKTLSTNVKAAKEMKTPFEFAGAVKTGGKWDLKNQDKSIFGTGNKMNTKFNYQGSKYSAEGLGNYHFGVVGKAYGFSDNALYKGAGLYQQLSEIINGKHETPFSLYAPYGDQAKDYYNISKGIKHYMELQK